MTDSLRGPQPHPGWKPGDAVEIPHGRWIGLDIATLDPAAGYKLLIGSIVPRPIAWVSTVSARGVTNVAPYSFFNGVASKPLSLAFSITRRPDGSDKDTLANIRATNQFVVNSANEWMAEAMHQTSGAYAPGESEFAKAGLTPEPSVEVKPPRVKGAAVQMECELLKLVPIGDGSVGSAHLVIGKILMIHAHESVYHDGKIDLAAYKPLSRLAGDSYGRVAGVFDLERPKV
ncbi:MAG: flavin reductase family protein [Bdellovibrionales bacterium]|nr:flavin reductase family protein [Bdellovibrionales bacterium]